MLRFGALLSALAVWTAFATSQVAADETGKKLPGTWAMTDVSGRSWNGTQLTPEPIDSIILEVTDHDGKTFAGTWSWKLSTRDLKVDDGKQVTHEAEEIVLGVLDFDGTCIMVDHPDTSIIRIKMEDDATLHMVGYEPGPHAVASRMVFKRQ